MKIDTDKMISITEVNRNFSMAAKLCDKKGEIVILKNNKPKYLLQDLESEPQIEMSDDEKLLFVAKRILKKYHKAFERLAE